KPPATYSAGGPPTAATSSASTVWSTPLPTEAHSSPSQRAMKLVSLPPAWVNVPPMYSTGPAPRPSSNTADANTFPSTSPRGVKVGTQLGVQLAVLDDCA